MIRRHRAGGLLAVLASVIAWPATAGPDPAFARVPALAASDAERDAALFFRSIHVADSLTDFTRLRRPGGHLLSLNPADATLPPVIFDSGDGRLTPVRGSAAPVDGIRILRAIELGPFEGRFAAAKARIRVGDHESEAWGYVDDRGRWIIAPRFDRAETPVRRWAKAGSGERGRAETRYLLDLEQARVLPLPAGRAPRYDAMTPLGAHVSLAMNREGNDDGRGFSYFVISAFTGQLIELPAAPAYGLATSGDSIALADGRRIDLRSGRVGESPASPPPERELLRGVRSEVDHAAGRDRITVRTASRVLARGLRAVDRLNETVFVACDQGEGAPLIRDGIEDPWPVDPGSKLRCGLMNAEGQWRTASAYQHFHRIDDATVLLRNAREWCEVDLRTKNPPACGPQMPARLIGPAGRWLDVAPGRERGELDPRLYGYRDAAGALKIPFRFERASSFVGRIAAVTRFGVPGLIDPDGRWLTPPPPAHVIPLVLESAARQRGTPCDSCFGLIDAKGEWVWPPLFTDALPGAKAGEFWVRGHGDSGFLLVDARGTVLRQAHWDRERLAEASSRAFRPLPDKIVAAAVNDRWGLTDADGKWLVPAQFEALEVMSDTRALARARGRWGMIGQRGEWIVAARFASFEVLNSSLALACDRDRRQCETFDDRGQRVADTLAAAGTFGVAGLAPAQDQASGRWGYLDRRGKWAIQPAYAQAFDFDGPYALARNGERGGRAIVGDPAGASPYLIASAQLWPGPRLAVVSVLPKLLLGEAQDREWSWKYDQHQRNARYGLIDSEGRWLVPKVDEWRALR